MYANLFINHVSSLIYLTLLLLQDTLEEQLVWYCPVCDKHFKSEGSLANHEKSKKHKEQLDLLRYELEADEAEFGGLEVEESVKVNDENGAHTSDNDNIADNDIFDGSSGSEIHEEDFSGSESEEGLDGTDSEDIDEEDNLVPEVSEDEEDDEQHMDEEEMLASLINSRVSISRNNLREESSEDEEEEESAEEEEEEAKLSKEEMENEVEAQEEKEEAVVSEAVVEEPPAPISLGVGGDSSGEDDWGTKKGKRKGKKGKGGEAQQQAQPTVQKAKSGKSGRKTAAPQMKDVSGVKQGDGLSCAICGERFDSRNKLFKHISKTGHAQLK